VGAVGGLLERALGSDRGVTLGFFWAAPLLAASVRASAETMTVPAMVKWRRRMCQTFLRGGRAAGRSSRFREPQVPLAGGMLPTSGELRISNSPLISFTISRLIDTQKWVDR